MDTMTAFAKGMANQGKETTNFDANQIKQKMEKHGVEKAEVFLSGDRSATNTTVRIIDDEVHGCSMGVSGSTWATPMLDINGTMFDVGTKEECEIIWDLDWDGNIKEDN